MYVAYPKMHEKMNAMVLQLNCIMFKWEKCGEGDSGIDNVDDGDNNNMFGSFENCSDHALHLCQSFMNYNQTYLLFLWHMLEKHVMLVMSMQKLSKEVNASNFVSGVPKVVNTFD